MYSYFSHAGEVHKTAEEAASHSSGGLTVYSLLFIILATLTALFVLVLIIGAKKQNKGKRAESEEI